MKDISGVGVIFDETHMAGYIPDDSELQMSPELCCFLQFLNVFLDEIKDKEFDSHSFNIQQFEYYTKYGDYITYDIDYNCIKSSIQNATNIDQIIKIFRDGEVLVFHHNSLTLNIFSW